jgi:hypothetical protein
MLDVGGRVIQQAFALAQIGAQFGNLTLRLKAGTQQAIGVKSLEPLRVAHVRLTSGHMLGVTRVDEEHLNAAFIEQLEDRNPIYTGRFHDDRLNSAFHEPISQPMEIGCKGPKAAYRLG